MTDQLNIIFAGWCTVNKNDFISTYTEGV